MPFADNQGTRIYWDEQGTGAPVLLIMGLGYPSAMWHRTRPALSASYRTIALDNRGAGQSEVPPGPYSIALMASMQPPCSTPPAFPGPMFLGCRWAA
jgi:pimeloyl-ACP methyl ester carboxylesterase